MTTIRATLRRTAAAAALIGAALLAAGPAAAATAPSVSVRETVQVVMDADGSVDTTRMYTQIVAAGNGKVNLEIPTSSDGLRDLNGFSKPKVSGGKAMWDFDVDDTTQKRTVASYDKPLPIKITPTYTLDGKKMKAQDIVGKSGLLEVRYLIENVTAESREISYTGVGGETVTDTGQVVVPLVGSLTIAVPGSFGELDAPDAAVAGNGRGVNNVSWTMVLFEPVGNSVQEVGYQARVSDAIIPAAKLQALIVQPQNAASTRSAQESYKGGAETGVQLTEGATTIDENLLKLQDGAGQLLDGLTQLAAGAEQLNAGLADTAAPGANQLADGAGQLADGTGDLKAGTRKLANGSGDLAAGSNDLAAGSDELAAGASQLSSGIGRLGNAVANLPASVQANLTSNPDYQRLLLTLQKLVDGIGTSADTGSTTLLGGLNQLKFGMRFPAANDCAVGLAGGTPTKCGVADAVELIGGLLADAASTGGDIDQLLGASKATYAGLGCPAAPAGAPVPIAGVFPPSVLPGLGLPPALLNSCLAASNVVYGLGLPAGISPTNPAGGLKAQTGAAAAALGDVVDGIDDEVIPGIGRLQRVLSNPGCNPAQTDQTHPAFCGYKEALALVKAGIPTLVSAILAGIQDELAAGIGLATTGCDPTATLACAGAAVAAGAGQVADGAGQVADGADLLADGAGQLNDGAGRLDDGARKVADGASKLAAGLGEAAVGSGKIADGLNQAAPGAKRIQDGAGQLSEEGTKKLVAAGQNTAKDFGTRYATMLALNVRGAENALPYGAIEDDTVSQSGAFSFELAAANKDGQQNMMRGALAVGALALGGLGGTFLYRRQIV